MSDQERDLDSSRRFNPTVWAVRLLTVAMLVVGIVVLVQRARPSASQEELVRYATFTVPSYLDELARLHVLLDRLGGSALQPAEARTLLVDELMPALIRMRKRAEQVKTEAPAVAQSNAEYLAALDLYLEMQRAAVRTLDDPAAGAEGARAYSGKRREADEAVRAFMAHLRERCQQAGIQLVPQPGAEAPAPK